MQGLDSRCDVQAAFPSSLSPAHHLTVPPDLLSTYCVQTVYTLAQLAWRLPISAFPF